MTKAEQMLNKIEKIADRTGATVGGGIGGWAGAAIGAEKGKRVQSGAGSYLGGLALALPIYLAK